MKVMHGVARIKFNINFLCTLYLKFRYGEYLELAELLHKYITIKDKLLVVGCGNSTIGPDLLRSGIT